MSALHISEFGGILPSVQKRNLPGSSAQEAHNLDLRFGDFRPLRGPGTSVSAVAAGAKSLFRTPSGVWLNSVNDVNYVNGQINDASFERVYLTGREAYPEAWQDGNYRKLGVPTPTAPPTVSLSLSDEFTSEEAAAATAEVVRVIAAATTASSVTEVQGDNPTPTAGASAVTVTDTGGNLGLWTRSPDITSGFNTSVVRDSATYGNPAPCYATVKNEADATPGYAYRNFGIAASDATDFSAQVMFHHPSTNNTWYQRREANVTVQATSAGEGVRVSLVDYDGMRGDPTVARLTIHQATGWGIRSTAPIATIDLAGELAQLTWYTIEVDVDWLTPTSAAVTARVKQGASVLATTSATATFGRGDYCGFHHFHGPDASAAIDGMPIGFITYYDNFSIGSSASGNLWVPHGTALGAGTLPTTAARDWAYLVRMSADGSSAMTYNPNEMYLKDASLGGSQVTYAGQRYWAVGAARYLGLGRELNQAALTAALVAIKKPPENVDQLLTNDTISKLVTSIAQLFDAQRAPTQALLSDLKAAEAAVLNTLESYRTTATSAAKTSGIQQALNNATAASDALTAWWGTSEVFLRDWISTYFSADVEEQYPIVVSRELETRAYLWTWVNDRGEESGTSPASVLVELDTNDSATVTVSAVPADRFIVGWRLYRNSTTNSSSAWQLVEDKLAGNAVLQDGEFNYFSTSSLVYTDSLKQGELQEPCPTLTWAEPPANMIGLVGLPNGIMAGFFDKTLCFCEPYQFHAWPPEYQTPLEYRIVGLGAFGQTLVVLTEGHPYYASGADSASMSAQKLESTQACASKRTIASMEGGVVYASPDGLCLAGPQGVELMTLGAFTRDDWQALDLPNCFGAFAEGVYHLFVPDAP